MIIYYILLELLINFSKNEKTYNNPVFRYCDPQKPCFLFLTAPWCYSCYEPLAEFNKTEQLMNDTV